MLVACTGDSDADDTPDAPEEVSVDLADGDLPAATVSFDAVPDADAYLLEFDTGQDPIRIEDPNCTESDCQLTLDRMTAADATTVTVTAIAGDARSSPASDDVDLPSWPDQPQLDDEWPGDGPVALQVTREGDDGEPTIEDEVVEQGPDIDERVQARAEALEAEDNVLEVTVKLPAGSVFNGDSAGGSGRVPEGSATWQEIAWTYDALPGDAPGSDVTVALVDSGVDTDHPALRGADLHTFNVVDPDNHAPHYHGTASASAIVGQRDGGVPGIAPGARLLTYDFANDSNYPITDWTKGHPDIIMAEYIERALFDAVNAGADVISLGMSFEECKITSCPVDWFTEGIEYAEQSGVVVVASPANDGPGPDFCDHKGDEDRMNRVAWPAAFDTVIAVGNADVRGERGLCSPEIDYMAGKAPGTGLRLADVDGGYQVTSGTSFATPLAAGLVAVILSERPDLEPSDIRSLLAGATDNNGNIIPLFVLDELGLLDAGVEARADGLAVDAVMTDEAWPYLGQTIPVAPDPGGLSTPDLLQDVLGPPAHTDPDSWRVDDDPIGNTLGGGSPSEAVPRPECWDGRLRLNIWEQEGSPLLAALYARENLSLDSGLDVSSGALLGYRVFQSSEAVRMADGVDIGQTHSDLVEAYAGTQRAPTHRVEFTGDDGEFELAETDYPDADQPTSTLLGPDLGIMSGQSDSATDTILERGAGLDDYQCGFGLVDELAEDRLVSAWLGGLTVHTDAGPVGLDFPDVERPGSSSSDDDTPAQGRDAVDVLVGALGEPDHGPDTGAVCPEPGMGMVSWGEPGPDTNEFFVAFDTDTGELLGYRMFDTERIRTSDGQEIGSSFDDVLGVYSADPITIIDIDWGGQRVEYELDIQPDDDVAGTPLPGPRFGVADGSDTDGAIFEFASGRECKWYVPRGDPSYVSQNCSLIEYPRLAELCTDT